MTKPTTLAAVPYRAGDEVERLREYEDTSESPLAGLRRLDAVASDLGFPSVAALRKWCERSGVEVYQPDRVAFVDTAELAALIKAAPRKRAPAAPKPTRRDALDDAVDAVTRRR